jgi:hypothetical protein
MTPMEQKLIETLIDSVNKLSARVETLEETIQLGRGGFKAILICFGLLGTIMGAIRMFGK